MTLDKFKELMKEYRAELQDNDCGAWSRDAREWAIASGLIQRHRHHGDRRTQLRLLFKYV